MFQSFNRYLYLPITLAVSFLLLLIQANCGGKEVLRPTSEQGEKFQFEQAYPGSSYNPFQPVKKVNELTPQLLSSFPRLEFGEFKLIIVDEEHNPLEISQASSPFTLRRVTPLEAEIALQSEWSGSIFMYLLYPGEEYFATEVTPSPLFNADSGFLFFSASNVSGVVAISVLPINGSGNNTIPPCILARVKFSTEPRRFVSLAASKAMNSVSDLTASINSDGTVLVAWTELHPGDYNNDGIVNISDVKPLADLFRQKIATAPNPGRVDLVDGTRDGEININDVKPLADNFFTLISGYNVYRTAISSPDEEPDPLDSTRWTRILREGADPPDAPPSVVRQFNNQDFRLPYTLSDAPTEPGFYAYFIRPFSKLQDNPNEGAISVVAKTSQPAGQPRLLLTVANSEGRGDPPIFSVGEDIILQVYLENAFDLFSANVRFLYRGDVLQLLEDVDNKPSPSVNGYEPNLLFDNNFGGDPLFLGLDVGDASADGYPNYRWSAMNATKRKPAETAFGSGALGYFRFRVIAGGPEQLTRFDNAFRFPQSSVFIYLMGENYGDFLPAPSISDTESIVISTL